MRNAGGTKAFLAGPFDDIRSRDLRFLQEASRLGEVFVLLHTDEQIAKETGSPPKFPFAERFYFLRSIRFVTGVRAFAESSGLADIPGTGNLYVATRERASEQLRQVCEKHGLLYHVMPDSMLEGFPEVSGAQSSLQTRKVVVTGCYDWLHSGHVRFFEEASSYGALYVVVGHDANIRLLKGHGHPLFPEQERRFQVSSVRHVTQALVSTGQGWLDADPEIQQIKPDIYAVNEDGDKGGKREYCRSLGIEYLVLKRTPAPGLPQRSSTALRGF